MGEECPDANDACRSREGHPKTEGNQGEGLKRAGKALLAHDVHQEDDCGWPEKQSDVAIKCSDDESYFADRTCERRQRTWDEIPERT